MFLAYKAKRADGSVVEGQKDAKDRFELARQLRAEGLTAFSVEEVGRAKKLDLNSFVNRIFSRISHKEKIFFASNLSEMITAGLALSRALSVLRKQTPNAKLAAVIDSVLDTVNQGGTFSSGLAKFPDVFDHVFISMVEAGEKSGQLPEALKTLSDQMQKSYALRKKIRGAMIYPSIIIIAMLGIAVIMLVYIVPTLSKTFKELGVQLPFTTRVVIGLSDFMSSHFIIFGILVLIVIAGILKARKSAWGKRLVSKLLLKLPVIKTITKEMNAAVTARTLASLVTAGVSIVEALRITEKILTNPYYKEVVARAQESVPKGANLSSIFQDERAEKIFQPFMGEMIEVGEETGKLSDMLAKLATFYENEVDTMTKDLSTVIEPVIMIIVGVGVGFFALSMIQPIYSIGSNL